MIEAGIRIGRYEIQSPLGVGGMGEVYRALDTELNRPVALKFLSADFAAQPTRMKRFIQEARAASALNHPNIITVYEIGRVSDDENAALFFATEFIDGITLKERMAKGFKVDEVIDIANQIASALVAAHVAEIIHRDIKPENIMLRHDGYIKVLDFGLAKPTERQTPSVDSEAETRALVNTEPGAVMGTVSYMSPEQARGFVLDARTDIWSLGIVLYEMITGHLPFTGDTPSHVIVSLLEDEPAPLAAYVPDVPEALEWIVDEALRKDRDERTQSAKQMLGKLRRLKQTTAAGIDLERSLEPQVPAISGSRRATAYVSKGARSTGERFGRATAHSSEIAAGGVTTSSAEYIVNKIKQHKRGALLGLLAGFIAVIGIVALLYKSSGSKTASVAHRPMKITSLTHNGKSSNAVISPDGRYVVHVFSDGDKQSLLLRQTATSSSKEIVPPTDGYFLGSTFTPDGNFLYYVKGDKGKNVHDLYQVPVLGGDSRQLLHDIDTPVTFSPDGKKLAFVRIYSETQERALFIANEDGTGEERLAARRPPFTGMDTPIWSPDGKTIAFIVSGTDADGYYVNIDEVRVDDKTERKISSDRWRSITSITWLPNGSAFLSVARDRAAVAGSARQIWRIAYPSGEAHKITNDLNNYANVSIAADSRTLVASLTDQKSAIWVAPDGDTNRARQISASSYAGLEGVNWTPDGRVIYTSVERDNSDIWVMNADGSNTKQLTFDPAGEVHPSVSPDDRYVVFESTRGVHWGIWRMNADGSNAIELVKNINNQFASPQCSADSRWVIYTEAAANGKEVLWKVSIDGGAPVQLTQERVHSQMLSPDGKLIACYYRAPEIGAKQQILLYSIEGGAPVKTLDGLGDGSRLRWSPDGTALDYIETSDGVSNIWRVPLAGGTPHKLTDWKSDQIFWFAWSPDGKQLACSRGAVTSDLVLIEDPDV